MCNQAEKIFLNFFLKGQGSPALYPIPFIPESNGKGGTHELCANQLYPVNYLMKHRND